MFFSVAFALISGRGQGAVADRALDFENDVLQNDVLP